MITRGFSFRFDVKVAPNQVQAAADALPIGDGITFNRLVGIYEDGHLVNLEMNVGDPVTTERVQLASDRMKDLLTKVTASPVRDSGLSGGQPDAAFQGELNKITPAGGSVLGGLQQSFESLVSGTQKTALYVGAAALAVLVLVVVLRR